MTTEELVDRLSSHRTIGSAPREELAWIATHGALRHYQAGQVVARHTEVIDDLYILLSGRISIWVTRGTRHRKVMDWQGGDVTGLLPYSRLLTPPGDTVVEEPVEAVVLTRDDLPELIRNCYEVTAILVHVMTDRARRFTSVDLRDEKLVSLGKLAAVLAHELNNPASAALRDAKSMAGVLAASEEAARVLGGARLNKAQLAAIGQTYAHCANGARDQATSGLALADREEEFADWLAAHGADQSVAEDLARTPLAKNQLDQLAMSVQGPPLEAALRWIAAGCAARSLAGDIKRAVSRIHALVTAVKGFTHMDRDPDRGPVDIRGGLLDTVALLEGKAREKSVTITLNATSDVPTVHGVSAEINQVWMNLIDNAIDASPDHGHIVVTATQEGMDVLVSVVDNGPGIPADVQGSIFDPFFTTKTVGEGTGLGLDIVRKIVDWHNGGIDVISEPGRTEFRVRLPSVSPAFS
jgi:signal transduction histidine kinase